MRHFLGRFWPIISLTLLSLILCFLNYQSHTWLTGWDNLHPEFNFKLDIFRNLSSVWVEYRSLGLLAGMAHAADLPRVFILYLLNSLHLLPPSLIRYFWTFLMLTLGPLGAYSLAKTTLFSAIGPSTRRFLSFLAGLFYLLNLSTIQNFYTPFEAFTTFYAALPWLIFSVVSYLKYPRKSTLLLLAILHLLSSPSFYVQTIFLVYLLSLLPFLTYFLFTGKHLATTLKQIFLCLVTIFITQAYWLLPSTYFATTHANITVEASQNQVATREMLLRNQEYGNLKDVFLLKGFSFDYVDLSDQTTFGLMLSPWIHHLSTPIGYLGYFFLALTLIGMVYSYRKRLPFRHIVLINFLLSAIFLINNNPPTQAIFSLFNKIPLLTQFFRVVFTKWSYSFALFYSLFFAAGCFYLFNLFLKLSHKLTPLLLTTILIIPLIIYSAPAFQGNLVYKNVRQELPQDYLDLFSFMKDQDPATRLANFPQNTFWGWQFYTWGYRGSGFLWYGLPQSTLDRAFDVWSPQSEAYYQDIKQAIYSQNPLAFQNTLEKYSITWLLTDHYVTLPGTADQTPLYMVPLLRLIQSNQNITKVKDFGPLTLYHYSPQSQPQTYLDTKPKVFTLIPPTPPSSVSTNDDVASIVSNRSSLKSKAKNCDNFNSKYFNKAIDDNAITYSAIDANSCDHLLYPFLPQGTSYDLKITHKNLSGSPLQLCLESYVSKTCTLFLYLPVSTNWTTTTLKVPVGNPSDYGYTLHLFNYSIGQTVASNQLKQIEFIPTQDSITIPDLPSHNVATIQDVNKLGTFLYSLTATATNQNDLLVLNQAYDDGWLLYQDDSPTSPLWQRYLLSLFKRPLNASTHSLTYGWANSWQIPQGQASYLLVYWPQILQFLGFISLLLLLPILLLHKRHS